MSGATLRERAGLGLVAAAAAFVLLIVVALLGFLVARGSAAMSWELLTTGPRQGMTEGGIMPAIFGTVLVSLVNVLVDAATAAQAMGRTVDLIALRAAWSDQGAMQ